MHSIQHDSQGVNGGVPTVRPEDWDFKGPVSHGEYPVMVDGKPRRHPENQPSAHEELSEDAKEALQAWIAVAVKPAKTVGPSNSYIMKHDFESAGGFYVTNGQFKGAMLIAGYEPVDRTELNWRFRQRPTNKHADGYSQYHALPGRADPGVARFKDLVGRVRAGRRSS